MSSDQDCGYLSSNSALTPQTSLESVTSSDHGETSNRGANHWKILRDRLHEVSHKGKGSRSSTGRLGKFGSLVKLAEKESRKARSKQGEEAGVSWRLIHHLEDRVVVLETALEKTQCHAARIEDNYNQLYKQVQMLLDRFRPLDGRTRRAPDAEELKTVMEICLEKIRNRDYVLRHVKLCQED